MSKASITRHQAIELIANSLDNLSSEEILDGLKHYYRLDYEEASNEVLSLKLHTLTNIAYTIKD